MPPTRKMGYYVKEGEAPRATCPVCWGVPSPMVTLPTRKMGYYVKEGEAPRA